MADKIPASAIANLIRAHYEKDETKFKIFAEFIADKYHDNNQLNAEKLIRKSILGETNHMATLDENSPELITVLENYRIAKLLANKCYYEMCSVLDEILTDREIEALTRDLHRTVFFPFTVPSPLTEFENQEGEGVTVEEFLENIKILKERLQCSEQTDMTK